MTNDPVALYDSFHNGRRIRTWAARLGSFMVTRVSCIPLMRPCLTRGSGRGRLLSVHLTLGAGSNLATRHAIKGQQEQDCARQHVSLPARLPRIGLSRTVTPSTFKQPGRMTAEIEGMVRPERFELPTCCSGGNRSIQLSYGRTMHTVYMGCKRSFNWIDFPVSKLS